jgi:hypothetical protein
MIEEIDQIVDYVLLPESESNSVQWYSDYIFIKLLERSCRKNSQPYSANDALSCNYSKTDFQADHKLAERLQSIGVRYGDLLNYRERFRLKLPETNK